MADSSDVALQIVTIRQLKEIVEQINISRAALNSKFQNIGIQKIKMLSIKRFNRDRSKLKGFLT